MFQQALRNRAFTSLSPTPFPDRAAASSGPRQLAVFALVIVCIVLGVVLVWAPSFAGLVLEAILVPLLLQTAIARTAFLVFGGLAVFQSSPGLDTAKVAYLAGIGIAVFAILWRLRSFKGTRSYAVLFSLIRMSLLFAAFVVFSLVYAIFVGASLSPAIRDAAPYLLFSLIPVFAIDLHFSDSPRIVHAMFILAGALASLGFSIEFLGRRRLAELPLDRLTLPSFLLSAALFSYASAAAQHGRSRRAIWTLVVGIILSLMLITATRSTLVFLVAPLAMALPLGRKTTRRSLRLLLLASAAGIVMLVVTPYLAQFVGADLGISAGRFTSLSTVFHDPEADFSFAERAAQTQIAWQIFASHPLIGGGPGSGFQWATASQTQLSGLNIDSPLSLPAKFGTLGVALLLLVAFTFVRQLRRLFRMPGQAVPRLALLGFAALVAVCTLLGSPFEDKGFSFGLLFLLTLSLPEENEVDVHQSGDMTGAHGAQAPPALRKDRA